MAHSFQETGKPSGAGRRVLVMAAAATLALGGVACGDKDSSSTGGSAKPQRGELDPKSDRMALPSSPGSVPAGPTRK